MQDSEPLGLQLRGQQAHARHVAAGPVHASDETDLHGIAADGEDGRDVGRCGLGRERGRLATGRDQHGWIELDDLGCQRRKPFIVAFGPAVGNRRVLAFDVAGLGEPLAESGDDAGRILRRPAAQEADDRLAALLLRKGGPQCKSGENPKKIAASHGRASRFGSALLLPRRIRPGCVAWLPVRILRIGWADYAATTADGSDANASTISFVVTMALA